MTGLMCSMTVRGRPCTAAADVRVATQCEQCDDSPAHLMCEGCYRAIRASAARCNEHETPVTWSEPIYLGRFDPGPGYADELRRL